MKNTELLLTVHAVVVRGGMFLVLQRSSHSHFGDSLWELPGGKVAPSSHNLLTDIEREVREETTIEIKIDRLLTINEHRIEKTDKRYPGYRHILLPYLCYDNEPTNSLKLSDEHDKFRWITITDLEKLDFMPCHKEIIREASSLELL